MALLHSASQTPHTIWTPIREDQFARTVQRVQNLSARVPEEARTHNQESGRSRRGNYVLSYNVEYQLAQDLAFIAVRDEGVHTVSAATVEKSATDHGLTFTIASNSGVKPPVREGLLEIGKFIERCAHKGNAAANYKYVC